ncbi:MAG: AIR synthase family protein [Sulfolobales archaeon]
MRIGKLRPEELERLVLNRTGFKDPRVLVGGSVGEDAAVIDIDGERALVVHTDPITGSLDLLGYLGVVIPSNDIAVRGVRPRWASTNVFLTPETREDEIDKIMRDIDVTARRLEIAVIGGHTEYTDAVRRPVIVTTIMGLGRLEDIVTTRGARPGDLVIMTKTAGVEGTAILARDLRDLLFKRGVSREVIDRASKYYENISIVREAILLSSHRLVSSMHDPTEGGVIAGLAEIAYASNTSINAYLDQIMISNETKIITEALGIDPLKMLSSGSLLACVRRDRVDEAIDILRKESIEARVIGEVVERRDYLVKLFSEDREIYIRDPYVEDPVITLFNRIFGNNVSSNNHNNIY